MNLNHTLRAEAHEQIIPLLEDRKIKEANDVARRYSGEDWDELIEEAKIILG